MSKRLVFRIVLIVALFIIGFVYLLRSCLSKFDERAAIGGGGGSQSASQFLVFEKDGKGVIFSLVKFDKTVSYSQSGGSTRKTVNTTYYAQNNDLTTADKIASKKIKNHREIKAYPVELIGASGNKAWLFAGELMAYDPFTLEKIADGQVLVEKNPSLRGKLLNERRYYEYDASTQQIRFSAADGTKYVLNSSSLLATPAGEETAAMDAAEARVKELEQLIAVNREQNNAAYDRYRQNNKLYSEKAMPLKQYRDSTTAIEKETARLRQIQDSLQELVRDAQQLDRDNDEVKRRKENARRIGNSFSSMRINCDTMQGKWYGLFTTENLNKLRKQFDHQSDYAAESRNKLYSATLTQEKKEWIIGTDRQQLGTSTYLQGGFLLSKETGLPIQLTDGFLIVHKDIIGNEGKVQLTRINTEGKELWSSNSGLKEFYEWQRLGNSLVVMGTDNNKLSSGEVNLLLVINLQTGAMRGYDYFTDKARVK